VPNQRTEAVGGLFYLSSLHTPWGCRTLNENNQTNVLVRACTSTFIDFHATTECADKSRGYTSTYVCMYVCTYIHTVLRQKELGSFNFAPKKPENARFHSTITPPPRHQKFCFLAIGKKISRKSSPKTPVQIKTQLPLRQDNIWSRWFLGVRFVWPSQKLPYKIHITTTSPPQILLDLQEMIFS
jgi:hypothetical protein